jgi:signal transduction histidine kinase
MKATCNSSEPKRRRVRNYTPPSHCAALVFLLSLIAVSPGWAVGRDGGWLDSGTRLHGFHGDLRAGHCRFEVIASSEGNWWNGTVAALGLNVAPTWYKTTWGKVACTFFGLLGMWTVHRARVRQVSRLLSARFDKRLAERTHIARNLHDTLLQTIQGSKLVVDDALEQPDDLKRLKSILEQLSKWLERAIQEEGAALNSLREPAVPPNDLAEALKRAVEERQIQDRQMEVHFSVVGEATELHPLVRYEAYQIADEAMRNAWTHGKGARINIELKYGGDLALRVRDDGVGMDRFTVSQGREGHFGLQGMRERSRRIEGKLTISSSVGSGTEVLMVVPGRVAFRAAQNRR